MSDMMDVEPNTVGMHKLKVADILEGDQLKNERPSYISYIDSSNNQYNVEILSYGNGMLLLERLDNNIPIGINLIDDVTNGEFNNLYTDGVTNMDTSGGAHKRSRKRRAKVFKTKKHKKHFRKTRKTLKKSRKHRR